jgi:hypothetical protein
MHTVDLLEEAIAVAHKAGFEIRWEVLEQTSSGACRVGSRWLLLIDPSLPAAEQLAHVARALRSRFLENDLVNATETCSAPLQKLLERQPAF